MRNQETDEFVPADIAVLPGISRIDDERSGTHGWRVHVERRGEMFVKLFSDGPHGGREAAHEAALAHRDSLIEAHPGFLRSEYVSILRRNNTSGVPGVCKYEKDRYWVAFWPAPRGKPRTAKFSIAKYGDARAFELAVAVRQRALETLDEPFTRKPGKTQPGRCSTAKPDPNPQIKRVSVQRYRIRVELHDGRVIAVPLAWFPALHEARHEDRHAWAITSTGEAITWNTLGLTVSVADLLRTA